MAAWRSMDDDDFAPYWERKEDRAVETGDTGTIDDYGDDWFQPIVEWREVVSRLSLDIDILADLRDMRDAA